MGAVVAGQDDVLDAFRANAPKVYKNLQTKFETSIVASIQTESCVFAEASPEHQSLQSSGTLSLRAKNGLAVVEMPSPFVETSPNDVMAVGENDKYKFQVKRTGDGPWIVEDMQKRNESLVSDKLPFFDARNNLRMNQPLSIAGTGRSLAELIVSDDFKIESAEVTPTGLLPIDFTITSPPEFTNVSFLGSLRSGQLIVDSMKNWRIMKLRKAVETKNGGTLKSDVDYFYNTPESNRDNLPSSSVGKTFYPGSAIAQSKTTYSWSFTGKQLSDRDFTLSAYGLPEPEWARESPYRWVRIAVFVVLGSLAALGLFILMSRRGSTGRMATSGKA